MVRIVFLLACIVLAVPAFAQAPSEVTVTEVARLERFAGPRNSSAHLSPDGERILQIEGDVFCVLTSSGEEQSCQSGIEQTGLESGDVTPDHDSVSWSPDGRFVAFTTMGFVLGTDSDIWVFDTERGEFRSVTDDGYEGRTIGDDIPDGVFIDVAPAWMPDGTLTFARHAARLREARPELWSVSPNGGLALPVAEFPSQLGELSVVYAMDWSPDGRTLAFVKDAISDDGGVWLYDAVSGQSERLLDVEAAGRVMRADFSPDGKRLLVLNDERGRFRPEVERDGHLIASVETGDVSRLDPQRMVYNAGWLPDGTLLYIARNLETPEDSGLFVTTDPAVPGEQVLPLPTIDGEPRNVFSPTARGVSPLAIAPNGLLLLSTLGEDPLLLVMRVEGAPSGTSTDSGDPAPAPVNVAALTATELSRLPLLSGPARTSAHLAPDGERLMHVDNQTFCLYAIAGEELGCTDMTDALSDPEQTIGIDPESISWSPDGRYMAFTTLVWQNLRDSDIWVLDVDSGEFVNATDDGYEGRILLGDDIPDTAFVDVAPTWTPDGRLTFARHAATSSSSGQPTLWAMSPDGWQPEQLTVFETVPDYFSIILAMDWSQDGSTLAYIVDSRNNPFAGLWLYDAAENRHRPLVYLPEGVPGFMRATFSPDGRSILLLDARREQFRGAPNRPDSTTGYSIVDVESGERHDVLSEMFLLSAGWLPSGGLLYTAMDVLTQTGGLFVRRPGDTDDTNARHLLDAPTLDGEGRPFMLFAPTNRQVASLYVTPDGRLLLGTVAELLLAVQIEGE